MDLKHYAPTSKLQRNSKIQGQIEDEDENDNGHEADFYTVPGGEAKMLELS